MIEVRPFSSLGTFQNDWLNAHYHFSFSEYQDPDRTLWGKLRVWNDDEIQPHSGFARHDHRDMEIITYVRTGAITHRDSLGNEGKTRAGDVQVMSAGKGILHEEFNEEDDLTTLYQIWILPRESGGQPFWDAAQFPKGDRSGKLEVLASGKEGSNALPIRADGELSAGTLNAGQETAYKIEPGHHVYVAVADGKIDLNGHTLGTRDGAAVVDESTLTIKATEDAEVIVVDTW